MLIDVFSSKAHILLQCSNFSNGVNDPGINECGLEKWLNVMFITYNKRVKYKKKKEMKVEYIPHFKHMVTLYILIRVSE